MEKSLSIRRSLPVPTGPNQPEAEVERKELHYNYLQLLCLLIGAQNTTVVAGRGLGKSQGILAPKVHQLLDKLHRASIVAIGTTYLQLLTRTLPELFMGMRRLGYEQDQDYWVRRFPDKKLGLKLPYNSPLDAQHAIFARNPGSNTVSVIRMVGQDRPGSANGLSVSALFGDEVKFLNKEKLDNEVLAINRGGEELYGDIAEHHSITFTTDMPTTREAEWVKADKTECLRPHHQEAIRLILSLQLELYRERRKLLTSARNAARLKRIALYEKHLNELRRGLVHYAEASSFANVHVLGLRYFKDLYRRMRPDIWKASVLNMEPEGVENGYYPHLSEQKHYYDSVDYAFIDSKDFLKEGFDDCRKDADLDPNQPLTIGMDYGSSFNCLHAGQRFSRLHPINRTGYDEVRHLKSFGLPFPHKVQDVVKLFTEYYRYFYKKEVLYVYDQTAVGKDGKSDMTYADEVTKALKAAGWKVKTKYFPKSLSHHARFLAWSTVLPETDDRFARQRFNRENTRQAFFCMQHAKTKQGNNGVEKDKTDEKNPEIDQSTTTHYTDAVDLVFWYLTIVEPNKLDLLPIVLGH